MSNNLPPKPPDCTCAYPRLIARNMTLHGVGCPAHERIMEEMRAVSGGVVVTREEAPRD